MKLNGIIGIFLVITLIISPVYGQTDEIDILEDGLANEYEKLTVFVKNNDLLEELFNSFLDDLSETEFYDKIPSKSKLTVLTRALDDTIHVGIQKGIDRELLDIFKQNILDLNITFVNIEELNEHSIRGKDWKWLASITNMENSLVSESGELLFKSHPKIRNHGPNLGSFELQTIVEGSNGYSAKSDLVTVSNIERSDEKTIDEGLNVSIILPLEEEYDLTTKLYATGKVTHEFDVDVTKGSILGEIKASQIPYNGSSQVLIDNSNVKSNSVLAIQIVPTDKAKDVQILLKNSLINMEIPYKFGFWAIEIDDPEIIKNLIVKINSEDENTLMHEQINFSWFFNLAYAESNFNLEEYGITIWIIDSSDMCDDGVCYNLQPAYWNIFSALTILLVIAIISMISVVFFKKKLREHDTRYQVLYSNKDWKDVSNRKNNPKSKIEKFIGLFKKYVLFKNLQEKNILRNAI